MLELRKMLENIDEYAEKLKLKKFDLDKEYFLKLNERISNVRSECQELQSIRNKGADKVGQLMREKEKNAEEIEKIKAEMTEVSDKVKVLETELSTLETELKNYMMRMPNIPADFTPRGKDEDENEVLEYCGQKPEFAFTF